MADPVGKLAELIDSDDNLTLAAFVYQISAKDVQYAESTGYWGSLDLGAKLEFLANSVGGRTIGYNPFPAVSTHSPTFELGNAVNSTTLIGAGLWLASEAGFLGSKWGTRGKKIAIGGAIGGVFDDPVSSAADLGDAIPSGNYAPNVRNGLPVGMSVPWTG